MKMENLRTVIKTNLGAGGRVVELAQGDLDRGIAAALKKLGRYLPETGFCTIAVTPTVQKYVVAKPNIVGITDVTFFNPGSRVVLYPYPDAAVDNYLILGQMKDQEKLYNDLPEWEWLFDVDANDSYAEKCYVLVHFTSDSFLDRVGRIPTQIAIQYKWYIAPTDDLQTGLPRLKHDLHDWVEEYATEFCRVLLGDIRGKFAGIPGPTPGETLPIDAAGLIERGNARMAELMEEMRLRQRQLPLAFD